MLFLGSLFFLDSLIEAMIWYLMMTTVIENLGVNRKDKKKEATRIKIFPSPELKKKENQGTVTMTTKITNKRENMAERKGTEGQKGKKVTAVMIVQGTEGREINRKEEGAPATVMITWRELKRKRNMEMNSQEVIR